MRAFIITNILFIIGMIILTLNGIHHWLVWLVYISVWGYADTYFAKDFHLSAWQWTYIIAGLTALDLFIIYLLK